VDLDKLKLPGDIEQRSAIDPFTGRRVRPEEIDDQYTAKEYEVKLMLDDRVRAMSEDLFHHFLDTGGRTKDLILAREHPRQPGHDRSKYLLEMVSRNTCSKRMVYFQCTKP
jgi:hypothetical protein